MDKIIQYVEKNEIRTEVLKNESDCKISENKIIASYNVSDVKVTPLYRVTIDYAWEYWNPLYEYEDDNVKFYVLDSYNNELGNGLLSELFDIFDMDYNPTKKNMDKILKELNKENYCNYISITNHSGSVLNEGFITDWDTNFIGILCCSDKKQFSSWLETLNQYLAGEIYCYTSYVWNPLINEWDEIGYCSDLYDTEIIKEHIECDGIKKTDKIIWIDNVNNKKWTV